LIAAVLAAIGFGAAAVFALMPIMGSRSVGAGEVAVEVL
jgi:hypothetical protein